MYVPPHFSESRPEVLKDFIKNNPFGVLVTSGSNGLDANHLPFELRDDSECGTLMAHVARANPLWQEVRNGDEVLVVFRAGDAYISPTWYPSKQAFHKQVPTWNYLVAHAHGRITIHDDERYVRGVVARLTRNHEASMPLPWKMTESPAAFIDTLLGAIVGIEIEISKLVGKSKLSQNKEVLDIRTAAEQLAGRDEHAVSAAMRQVAAEKERSERGGDL